MTMRPSTVRVMMRVIVRRVMVVIVGMRVRAVTLFVGFNRLLFE